MDKTDRMAQQVLQEQQEQMDKMALMDKKSYEKYAGKEVVDGILKCPKCKSMKTEYTEVQTRSAEVSAEVARQRAYAEGGRLAIKQQAAHWILRNTR